ncbi:precorrin-8X methylmutase [Methanospirillum sp.]|uniref:precorrin-8X methylmutase n=1 Tax=Methanospirillum sp. TaxID=45200 RepID=UPI002B57B1CB|nr:precorrin-8X methylmutase [Methanospirillum sp.]HOL41257.1 precorrin-8X methylmutase [Methanospirillum sp.]HPP77972.1 precorrin-8X methylmutase [Methanospirillum sp.]
MPKESSPPAGTAGSMYTDIGADTPEGYAISRTSRELARKTIGDGGPFDRIRQRCSIAVGDFAMADLMRFTGDPVRAGLAALQEGAPIYTDIRMVQTGIQKKGHHSQVTCILDTYSSSDTGGKTRTSAALMALGERLSGSIVVIGNAPSALLVLCELIQHGIRPALVIGTPVGFVNAAESKELLRTLDIPSISNEGTRGGTPVAVAAMNEIITMYAESNEAPQ